MSYHRRKRAVIESLLRELGTVVDGLHPGWTHAWQPGLTRAEIEAALAPLDGWRPPEEILALYRWRNGHSGECCLWVPFQVLSLQEAVADLQAMRSAFPRWPPLLSFAHGDGVRLAVPLSRGSHESAPLYHHDKSGEPFCAFTGLEGLLRASLEAYQRQLFCWSPEYRCWRVADDAAEAVYAAALRVVRLGHNPGTSPTLWDEEHEERGAMWMPSFDPTAWPTEWHDFIGFDAAAFVRRGATATIDDVVVGRVDWSRPVIVEGRIDGLVAFGDEFRVCLGIGAQSIEVLCRGVLASGVRMGEHFEIELEPPLGERALADLRREREALDQTLRESLQRTAAAIASRHGDTLDPELVSLADVVSTDLGAAAVFVARRVARVARGLG